LALAILLIACEDTAPARPQWVVTLATDAPVPALGDRVLVEIYDDDGFACSSCRRAFGAADVSRWPLSFGIRGDSNARRIRARMFRAATLSDDGTPETAAVIDALGTLPPDPQGAEKVTLVLHADCFGIASDVPANTTCEPATRQVVTAPELADAAAPPRAGTWPPAAEVDCPTPSPTGMACMPGGVFLLGDPVSPPSEDPLAATLPERLVRIAPFHLDTRELTVGEYLDLRDRHPELAPPVPKGFGVDDLNDDCTFSDSTPDRAAPLNCVAHDVAASYCFAQGKRLPTEAEWEYAASNGDRDDRYPWGTDDDICGHAVVARGFISLCRVVDTGTLPRGPVAGGSAKDANRWGIGDLGGNLSEWVADSYQGYGIGCWAGSSVIEAPRCADPTGLVSVRGGNWDERPISARAARRQGASAAPLPTIGVRCARDP